MKLWLFQEQYFNWTSTEQGLILSAFFYGYITTQLAGGYFGQKIGGNIVKLNYISLPSYRLKIYFQLINFKNLFLVHIPKSFHLQCYIRYVITSQNIIFSEVSSHRYVHPCELITFKSDCHSAGLNRINLCCDIIVKIST